MAKGSTLSVVASLLPVAASFVTLYDSAIPGGMFGVLMLAGALWLATAAFWLVSFITRGGSAVLTVSPVLLILTVLLTQTGVPIRMGFLVSKEGLGHRLETGESGRAGIYQIDKPISMQGPIRLPVHDSGFIFTESGFLYA